MKNVGYLVKKNLKVLVRSKSSALIVILAPLMLILLIGLSYNTSETGLNIGIYSAVFTEEIEGFLGSLQEEDYKVVKYEEPEECVEDIKLGFVHTCLVLPDDFQVKDNTPKEVVFHIDQTKINLVYLIMDSLSEKFNLKSKEVAEGLVGNMLTKFSKAKDDIGGEIGQVEGVKGKSQGAVDKTGEIDASLGGIDLAVTDTIHDTAVLANFKSSLGSEINSVEVLLSSAKSAVSSSDLNSSEKSPIVTKLDEIDTKLDQLMGLVNGTGAGSLEGVSSLITALQNDLSATKDKLTAASGKVSATGTQIEALKSTLGESIAALEGIKANLGVIQTELGDLKVTSAGTIAAPLSTKIEMITVEKTHLNYLFPSLMVLVVMFVAILLGTTLVMAEKHNKASFRNFIVPVKKITFVFSTYLTNIFLILFQIAIILGISLLFLEDVLAQFPLTALILFIAASVFTLGGMIIGYVFTSEDTGVLASISVGSFLLFVSGVILPLESMSVGVRQVVYFNPFVISEKLVREVFIFDSGWGVIWGDLLLLLSYAVVLFVIILIIDSISSKHFLTKMMYQHHKGLREKKRRRALIKARKMARGGQRR